MRVIYILLLPLCLLFAQMAPGAALLTDLFHKYPEYLCAKKGGTCNFSPCPLYTKAEGFCYRGKAKCCI
uniref:Beta-defensin 1 n=1 Tax=Molossus molossus TaxID=27622 RepID=A0A7J8GJQ1_MOLMO|nr:defensin beta 1 [Molossus molossus]